MNIRVTAATEMHTGIISKMLQEYLSYLSTFERIEIDQNGEFIYPYLDLYWEELSRSAFLIVAEDLVIGFALIREVKEELDMAYMSVAEFYVIPTFQRKGVGEKAARLLFDLYPGNWRLSVIRKNLNGLKFWRKVLKGYTGNEIKEKRGTTAVLFSFYN